MEYKKVLRSRGINWHEVRFTIIINPGFYTRSKFLFSMLGDLCSSFQARFFFLSNAREELLNLGDGETRIETLGAGFGAVHDGVTAVDGELVKPHLVQPLSCVVVSAVNDPSVGLHEHSGP